MTKKEILARDRILIAAKTLFYKKGYEQVTVREIAKEADCSHTSIYVYFNDKQKLLEELAEKPLDKLIKEMNAILTNEKFSPEQKLIRTSQTFVHFGLFYRNLYQAFVTFDASRVDLTSTKWELNKTRLRLFDSLKSAVKENFTDWGEAQLLEFSRMIYYMLHGIIMTYKDVEERVIQIERRVFPIVKQSVHYFVKGVMASENPQGIS
ncbi:TetR/AcrR family transcriptional regulator (plasmid) [Pseudalkalibacillus hwajinpoensis]|uniref:TetR/AcrR family transcriptional regulator n=1 Tax=Guptibacillus hwajinpoensis TaxID=208199 RepID=UPI00325BEDDA